MREPPCSHWLTCRMSERPAFTVEYLEPVEAEPLPDEFSASRLRRSLLLLAAVVLVVVAAILLVPGLGSLRSRFMGARPEWLALAGGRQAAADRLTAPRERIDTVSPDSLSRESRTSAREP
jgi:hypothetical protein